MKLGVIGGGSWGTAIAVQASIALGHSILYMRDKEVANRINSIHINTKYLPNILLPKTLRATNDIDEIFKNEILVFAIPSKHLVNFLHQHCNKIKNNHIILIATKGLDNSNLEFFSSYFKNKLNNENICILSGPNFAAEVASKKFSFSSLASENFNLSCHLANLLSTDSFIIHPSDDVVSLQLSGTIKNIIAITIGISHGIGNGDNFRAFLIAQGANEIKKLSLLMGGNEKSFLDIASMGDLILTCTSMNSRNTNFGFQLTRTKNPKKFISNFPTLVEGKESLEAIYKLSQKYNIHLPIIFSLHKLLTELKEKESIEHKELNEIFTNFFAEIISAIESKNKEKSNLKIK
jgi:glycerol-3-phosphate dehydrogenase (NAD(P)+)